MISLHQSVLLFSTEISIDSYGIQGSGQSWNNCPYYRTKIERIDKDGN